MQEETNKRKLTAFDDAVKGYLCDYNHVLNDDSKSEPYDWSTHPFADGPDFQEEFDNAVNNPEVKEADELFTPDTYDHYLQMELALPQGDSLEPRMARVTKRLKDSNCITIGTADQNPLLDTRMYEVEFADGEKACLMAKYIAENLFAQADDVGNRHVLMNEIIDYRTNRTELKQQDAFITTKTGTKCRRETTKGLELSIEWKDGSTNWVSLKDIKKSYPIEVAEFALATCISMEPAFAWWVPFMLKKRNRILAKVKSKYCLMTHKFGIRIPKTVEEAKKIDEHNGDTLWWDAICKEMRNVHPAFEVFEGQVENIPKDYQLMWCHMILDVKFGENFRCKARLVAGGHMTDTPNTLTYSSVVSRDSVHIALTIAALNELSVMACDIQNAYLTAECREKIWTRAGPEFGSESDSIMLVKKVFYGLKGSGAAFRAHLAEKLHDIGFIPTRADPDVWRQPAVKPDGFEYYEYILCYVDNLLAISHDAQSVLKSVQDTFKFKDSKIDKPDVYLGAQLDKMSVDGFEGWTMSSEKYVKSAIENIEQTLAETNQCLPTKC